jgi:hypothetical protein
MLGCWLDTRGGGHGDCTPTFSSVKAGLRSAVMDLDIRSPMDLTGISSVDARPAAASQPQRPPAGITTFGHQGNRTPHAGGELRLLLLLLLLPRNVWTSSQQRR